MELKEGDVILVDQTRWLFTARWGDMFAESATCAQWAAERLLQKLNLHREMRVVEWPCKMERKTAWKAVKKS